MERQYPYTDANGFTWYDADCYTDDVGGEHDSGIGWNPRGHWCGECTIASCRDCPCKNKPAEKAIHLVYGTYYATPWEETLLKITSDYEKAKDAVEKFRETGNWIDLFIETRMID